MSHWLFAPVVLYQPQTCFAGPDEVEPNNNRNTANGPLCHGVIYRGLPNDTFDFFQLITTKAGRISAEVKNHYGQGVQLALFGDNGRVAIDLDQTDGLEVIYEGPPGAYYIVIYTETPQPAETRKYSLEVVFP
jgi:hypothetical protein